MPLVSAASIVLQVFPYSDTSKILRLLTRDWGVQSVIAKGAQRPRSRFGGILEPFTEGDAHFFLREGRDLHTLSGFDLVRSRQSLGRDLAAFTGASLLAEIALRFSTEEPNPDLFDLLAHALDDLAESEEAVSERVVIPAVWRTVALVGYQPETEACVRCGDPLPIAEPARFDARAGGVACARCRPAGRVLGPASRAELHAMLQGEGAHDGFSRPAVQHALLGAFLRDHLAPHQPLRSLEFFLQQLSHDDESPS